jgi:hypothetical protein
MINCLRYVWVAKWFIVEDEHTDIECWSVYTANTCKIQDCMCVGVAWTGKEKAYEELYKFITEWGTKFEFVVVEHPDALVKPANKKFVHL